MLNEVCVLLEQPVHHATGGMETMPCFQRLFHRQSARFSIERRDERSREGEKRPPRRH